MKRSRLLELLGDENPTWDRIRFMCTSPSGPGDMSPWLKMPRTYYLDEPDQYFLTDIKVRHTLSSRGRSGRSPSAPTPCSHSSPTNPPAPRREREEVAEEEEAAAAAAMEAGTAARASSGGRSRARSSAAASTTAPSRPLAATSSAGTTLAGKAATTPHARTRTRP